MVLLLLMAVLLTMNTSPQCRCLKAATKQQLCARTARTFQWFAQSWKICTSRLHQHLKQGRLQDLHLGQIQNRGALATPQLLLSPYYHRIDQRCITSTTIVSTNHQNQHGHEEKTKTPRCEDHEKGRISPPPLTRLPTLTGR